MRLVPLSASPAPALHQLLPHSSPPPPSLQVELFRVQQFSDWETDTQAQLEGMSSWKNSRLMTFDSHNR